jgi:hypothetical protein
MVGFILFLVSTLLKVLVAPLLYIHGCIVAFNRGEFRKYNQDLAVAKDQYGNVVGQYFSNKFMVTKNGYQFGKTDETISSVIGKNKQLGTLKWLGRWLDARLNTLETDHSIKSIEIDE